MTMSIVESKLAALGLVLPAPLKAPDGVLLPFAMVRIVGTRAFVSGHGPQNADGSLARPLGKVGSDLTIEQGYAAARLTALSIVGSLQRVLGDLDRIRAWSRVFGMVNSAPGFVRQPAVINGFSDLVLEVFGADIGAHARSAVGLFELPFSIPVEVEAEVEIDAEGPVRHLAAAADLRAASSAGVRCISAVMTPSPPACETAAASSAKPT